MVGLAGIETEELARRVRVHCLNMTSRGKSSHIGSTLSVADILAVLYNEILQVSPQDPARPDRDRLILSKGHAGAAIYAVLAECGFFPSSRLVDHCQDGSVFSGHVSHYGVPGVELSTGSLGHGLGVGVGMAKAASLQESRHRVFVVLSDGECDEGSVWEAALFAAHHRLSNLVAVVDYNKIQSLDTVAETLGLEPFAAKWSAFGWKALEADGHDARALRDAFAIASNSVDRPTVVLAHTVKGKGVSFMEGSVLWHYRSPQGSELEQALAELQTEK